ncbi:PP2C family protein-serine/threonine phosphatase [Sulfitobacter alexandrii]|uniref:PP2C family protein-serine/threonine phosphatase n=1 Tax=Sulfitobacter alexandrii TaxID=1917485 RepID=UPI0009F9B766|nr:fused response regulator/phosphatase [Sulfitobacter alexandrii]
MRNFIPAKSVQARRTLPETSTRILVVDDSRLQRRLLAGSLKRWGYEVTEAGSAEEALQLCRSEPPDLVLSDWMMPGMNGIEFCRAFRDLSADRFAYFILLTSKREKAEVVAGLHSGADDFLSKPVDGDELRARITAGERIIGIQKELSRSNRLIRETLSELQTLYDSLDKDLLEAKKLQQSLLPERHRVFRGGTLSLMLRSSGHVGGDLVGFFEAGPRKLCLYGIDVSGHGISSALMTARLAGYLSSSAPGQNLALTRDDRGNPVPRPPAQAIQAINELVLNEMDTEHYFTLLLANVDLDTGLVQVAQAGHPHPVIRRRDGKIEQFGTGGFPVGLLSGVSYRQFDIQLQPGDRLLILSDGFTECPDPLGRMLGEDGLARIVASLGDMHDEAFLSGLLWKLSEFSGASDFPDDLSGLMFQRNDPTLGQE